MATLADQRRAIAEGMRASRQATGEAERRATGEAMVRRRTGRDDVDDINAVVRQPRQRTALPAAAPRGGVPAQVGTGNYTVPPATGGGIASPLTEVVTAEGGRTVPDREYWPNMIMSSSDGLRVWEVRPIKTWRFVDANGDSVVLNIAQPRTPEEA